MARLPTRREKDYGTAPGTLVFVGTPKVDRTRLSVMDYSPSGAEEKGLASPEEAFAYRDSETVSWINVEGLHDVGVVERIGAHFGLHPLVQADIVNTGQRPKIEEYDDHIYIVLKMLHCQEPEDGAAPDGPKSVVVEQVSIVLGRNFVLLFQEAPGDVFEPVRARIRNEKARIRRMGADYLAYSLVDAVVDGYFAVLDRMEEMAESIEDEVFERPSQATLQRIQLLRNETIVLRRAVSPLREVVNGMRRHDGGLVSPALAPYLGDVYDHTVQVNESLDALRDVAGGLRDTYLSSLSNRMNEIMKVLTVIATIFIPLTFIAGVYGMNFDPDISPLNMPEIRWPWGYPAALGAMAAVAGGMLLYFRKKRWL